MTENLINIKVTDRNKRIWEIDFLRGLAIIGMVILHFLFVTTQFYGIEIFPNKNLFVKFIEFLQNYGGIVFIFISGIASIFSKNNFKRGSQLFLVAMGITYATLIYDNMVMLDNNNYVVRFGILHFLSICMMLAPWLLKTRKRILFILAVGIILIGNFCRAHSGFDMPGLTGYEIHDWFLSADYFPLLPYSGYFIFGIVAGKILYNNGTSLFKSEKIANNAIVRFFTYTGKHTLAVYLIHQPVLIGILEALLYFQVIKR
jgi:uncharacterized membrane protein